MSYDRIFKSFLQATSLLYLDYTFYTSSKPNFRYPNLLPHQLHPEKPSGTHKQDVVCYYYQNTQEHGLIIGKQYRYAVARPSEFLLITGAGIEDIRICKKAFVLPFQRVRHPLHIIEGAGVSKLKPIVRENRGIPFRLFAQPAGYDC